MNISNSIFGNQTQWINISINKSHIRYPYLTFVYEGEIEERTLITEEDATKHSISPGIYSLRAAAPSVLYFPAGMPYKTGGQLFSYEKTSRMRALRIAILDDIRVHTRSETEECQRVSHSLSITDPSLLATANLFERVIKDSLMTQQDVARAILLAFVLRLRRQFTSYSIQLVNMSFPPLTTTSLDRNKNQAYQKAVYFIQVHLHESLTITDISREAGMSPAQLNHYFRKFEGTSIMAYVKRQRMEAAKAMLRIDLENVSEIAKLLNYRHSSAFCAAFREETGMTPLQYKRNILARK